MSTTTSDDTFVAAPGNIVQLKSGGPPMTCEARYDPAVHGPQAGSAVDALCTWFAGAELKSHWFPDCVLKPATTGA